MTREEIIEFLKESLAIEIDINQETDYNGGVSHEVTIRLKLDSEIISSDSRSIYIRTNQ